MVGKRTFPELVSAEEAVKVGLKAGGVVELQRVSRIYTEWMKNRPYPEDPHYDTLCMLATVYCAGMIQGIREERSRKREHE